MDIIIAFSVILIIFLFTFLLLIIPDWLSDIKITKENSSYCAWGTYKNFLIEFNKRKWELSFMQCLDCADQERDNDLHTPSTVFLDGGIIRFDNAGMLMRNPISHIRMKLYVKRMIRKILYNKWIKEVV